MTEIKGDFLTGPGDCGRTELALQEAGQHFRAYAWQKPGTSTAGMEDAATGRLPSSAHSLCFRLPHAQSPHQLLYRPALLLSGSQRTASDNVLSLDVQDVIKEKIECLKQGESKK